VNFVYSTEADALYIRLEANRKVAQTIEISPSCLVDLDVNGRPLGIELLNPATSYLSIAEVVVRWKLSPEQIAQLLVYPYQSLTPHRRAASSTAGGRVEIEGRKDELLTCA